MLVRRLVLGLETRIRPFALIRMCSNVNSSIFVPPEEVRGMIEFDAAKFTKKISIPCVEMPSKLIGRVLGAKPIQELSLRRCLRLKHIINGETNQSKVMLFDPDLIAQDPKTEERICESIKLTADIEVNIEYRAFTMTYQDWDVKRCLKAVLPKELDFSGHTQAGHILHLNLREELMPYKFVIGRILLDKIQYAKTVVNKLDQINSEFRFFDLELLAGEPNYITTVTEKGFKYQLDFSKVFWNSRLGNEHTRIIENICKQKKKTILFDVCAGVGPFVVPVMFLKHTLQVYANDLNPASIDFLKINLKLNKAPENKILVYNIDGAEFIRTVLPVAYSKHCLTNSDESINFHIVMNLPALAVNFLPTFCSVLAGQPVNRSNECIFIVYCYMFVKATEDQSESWFEEQAIHEVTSRIPANSLDIIRVVYIRNVANRKNMYCVELKLHSDYLHGTRNEKASIETDCASAEKRRKLEL